jgi:hypothetical protein
MAIEVYSPHSGHPVKVRQEDIGRAIRDEAGQIFYVVPREEGSGYYASLTRTGSTKDQQRYDELAQRIARGEFVPEPPAGAAASGPAKPHDATGRRRIAPLRLAVLAVILLALLSGLGMLANWWFNLGLWPSPAGPPATQPATQPGGGDSALVPMGPVPPRWMAANRVGELIMVGESTSGSLVAGASQRPARESDLPMVP